MKQICEDKETSAQQQEQMREYIVSLEQQLNLHQNSILEKDGQLEEMKMQR